MRIRTFNLAEIENMIANFHWKSTLLKNNCPNPFNCQNWQSRAKLNPLSSASSIGKSWGSCPLPLSFVVYRVKLGPSPIFGFLFLVFSSSSSSSSPWFWVLVNCCQHDKSIFFLFSLSSPSFLFLLVFFTNYCFLGFLHSLFSPSSMYDEFNFIWCYG